MAGAGNPAGPAAQAAGGLDPAAEPLFERLREWRRATAAERQLPPYVIFHDSTLRAIAAIRPRTLDALAGVSGVGQRKLEAWGDSIIALIAAHDS